MSSQTKTQAGAAIEHVAMTNPMATAGGGTFSPILIGSHDALRSIELSGNRDPVAIFVPDSMRQHRWNALHEGLTSRTRRKLINLW
jgi:hypothetical protein